MTLTQILDALEALPAEDLWPSCQDLFGPCDGCFEAHDKISAVKAIYHDFKTAEL